MNRWRWAALAVAAVIFLNILVAVLDSFYGAPSGPPSSSYATTPEGIAAFATLLERTGHEVTQLRDELTRAQLDPSATVVILDPQGPSPSEQATLRTFIERGGNVVAGGAAPDWIAGIAENVPTWSPDGERDVHGPSAYDGVQQVRTAGGGSWIGSGAGEPTLGDPARPLAVELHIGDGSAQLLADTSPLQNRLLDQADNAALGLALVGPPGQDVTFVESQHGYTRGSGLGALPTRWKWFCAGLLLAVTVWLWAKSRRLGPPEEPNRQLPPARTVYVEALAATLARTERRRRGTK